MKLLTEKGVVNSVSANEYGDGHILTDGSEILKSECAPMEWMRPVFAIKYAHRGFWIEIKGKFKGMVRQVERNHIYIANNTLTRDGAHLDPGFSCDFKLKDSDTFEVRFIEKPTK